MKRQPRNKQNSAVSNSRSLRVESLEDRNLMTVAAEMVQMPQESQIGSEHWPEPAAEIAVEKATNERQGFFSRGLHNNGAFHDPAGHILWNASDDSETSSDSYTDSGRITYYAYELKNVLLTSVRDGQGNDKSSFLGIPSCPEVASNWQDRNNVVLEDVVSFEAGSSHCVEIAMFSSRASNDPVFFSHHANVDKVFGENGFGGQEDEPVTENQFSLNFEEIKVTYADPGDSFQQNDSYFASSNIELMPTVLLWNDRNGDDTPALCQQRGQVFLPSGTDGGLEVSLATGQYASQLDDPQGDR